MDSMFRYALIFDQPLSDWDVSGVTNMSGMFTGADYFNQNLGAWCIILDDTSIDIGSGAKKIGNITAQNPILGRQYLAYGIGSGADSALFAIDGNTLKIKPSSDYSGKTEYAVKITATSSFGVNNFQVINVTVTGADTP